MAAIDPMHQFLIRKMVEIPPIETPWGALDLSITNSVAMMLTAAVFICAFFACLSAPPDRARPRCRPSPRASTA